MQFCILVTVIFAAGSLAVKSSKASGDSLGELKPTEIPVISLGNLHTHTICSDGKNSYEAMIKMAIVLGFSFISITDHRFGGTPLCDEVIAKCKAEKRLLCIPGMEVTGKVHLLAIGIRSPINERLSVKEQVKEIHRQGGLAIAAHPLREGNIFTDEELFKTGLDAVECVGVPENRREAFYSKLKEKNIPCVYNSDAHNVLGMLLLWNSCEGEIKSFADLKKALKEHKCKKRW